MAAPTYSIGDLVYIVASAKIGFLESYKITGIHSKTGGKYVYQINLKERHPNEKTIGDAVDLKRSRSLFFDESELTDFCTASSLRITYLQRKLSEAQSTHDSRCEETG